MNDLARRTTDPEVAAGVDAGVLRNMSARPRTPVTCSVRPLRRTWVSFTMPRNLRVDETTRVRLDAAWSTLGFTGAALVQLGGTTPSNATVHRCADADLAANVVLRTRGSLLLAEMCLLDDVAGLTNTTLFSSDPRLVAWAGGAP